MRRRRGRLLLPSLLTLLSLHAVLLPERSWGFAPDHRWRTLETPHFVVHFHEGLYPLALRSARSLEAAHERFTKIFATQPNRKTQVVLSDDTDDANGAATTFERPRIWLQAAPPDDLSVLGDFDDYVFLLVAHEYVHVLQLGTASGPSTWLNALLGDLWLPNSVLPRLFTEGLATYHESQASGGGRIRSAIFDMYLRADVLEDRLMPLSQLTSGGIRWPRGTAAYLYGGSFLSWLAATHGDEVIRAFIHGYGGRLIPYFVDYEMEAASGSTLTSLWNEWVQSIHERYERQLALVEERGPLTEPVLRTHLGDRTGAPRWGEGGLLYYVEATAHRRPALRRLDPHSGDDRRIRTLASAGTLAPLQGAGRMILSRPEFFGAYRIHGELFEIGPGGERQLSKGLRASEPDTSRDGRFVYYIERRSGRTTLMRLPLLDEGAAPEFVYEPPAGQVLYTPRLSPDGALVALSQSRSGPGRDIVLIPAEPVLARDARALQLTDDAANDLGPTWTPDGRELVFTSDRTGIFNLYALTIPSPQEQDASELPAQRRLTNVLTGAFQPDISPDGRWIAWTTYGSKGFDVAVAPLDSLSPTPAAAFVDDRPPSPGPPIGEAIYPLRRYRPWETLAPQSWFPYLGADRAGLVVGATLMGEDVVARHGWTLSAGWGVDSAQPEAAASYGYRGWYLQPTLVGGTTFRSAPGLVPAATERVSIASAGLSLPLPSMRRSQALSLRYGATFYQPIDPLPGLALPPTSAATELQLQWQLSDVERPAEGISLENGYTLSFSGRIGSTALGGDYDYQALEATSALFLRLPWGRHHVLALDGRAAASSGDLAYRRLYGLGGPLLRNPLLDLLFTGRILGGGVLRGYGPSAFVGNQLLLGSAEYRFPIVWIDRSPQLLPLYAGKLAGAIFADAGSAFDDWGAIRLHPSAGAELRLGVDLGWRFVGALRLGWAWGFDRSLGGGSNPYLGVGASF